MWILRGGVLSGRASLRWGGLLDGLFLFCSSPLFLCSAGWRIGGGALRGERCKSNSLYQNLTSLSFTSLPLYLPPPPPPPCSLFSSLHFPPNLLLYEFPSFFLSFLFPFSLNVRAPPAPEGITCMSHPSHPQTLYFLLSFPSVVFCRLISFTPPLSLSLSLSPFHSPSLSYP